MNYMTKKSATIARGMGEQLSSWVVFCFQYVMLQQRKNSDLGQNKFWPNQLPFDNLLSSSDRNHLTSLSRIRG